MKKRTRTLIFSMLFILLFVMISFGNTNQETELRNPFTKIKFTLLPKGRMNNFTISGFSGHSAIAFGSNDILVYDEMGAVISYIKVDSQSSVYIEYNNTQADNIRVYIMRGLTGYIISEEGEIVNTFERDKDSDSQALQECEKGIKENDQYIFKSSNSFNYPLATNDTRLIRINKETGEEKIIYDNFGVCVFECALNTVVVLVMSAVVLFILTRSVKSFRRKVRLMSGRRIGAWIIDWLFCNIVMWSLVKFVPTSGLVLLFPSMELYLMSGYLIYNLICDYVFCGLSIGKKYAGVSIDFGQEKSHIRNIVIHSVFRSVLSYLSFLGLLIYFFGNGKMPYEKWVYISIKRNNDKEYLEGSDG